MPKRSLPALAALAFLISGCTTASLPPTKDVSMITHSVFFKLKHPAGSDAERIFLRKAVALSKIPGIENFQVLEETSPKNAFTFGLSMEFADQAAYDHYNNHPDHVAFVQDIWLNEVADFQEIDHIPFEE